ncbi:MAG: hypothetical protein R3313_00500 [Candidatus Saccharimonadales bacterium]|nr:hypothetical protein [Candidatus Saccharimonadales bacterium]
MPRKHKIDVVLITPSMEEDDDRTLAHIQDHLEMLARQEGGRIRGHIITPRGLLRHIDYFVVTRRLLERPISVVDGLKGQPLEALVAAGIRTIAKLRRTDLNQVTLIKGVAGGTKTLLERWSKTWLGEPLDDTDDIA